MKQPDQQRATAYGGVVTHLRHSPVLRCVTYLGAAVTIQQSCGALYGAVSDLKSWTPLAMHMTAAPFVATLTWQFRNLGQPRPQDRRLLTARALRQVRAGLLLGTTAAALVVGMPALIGWTQRVEQSTTLIPLTHVMASVCYVALGNVAVTANEELVFRGYGLDVATEVVGKSVAIVGSVALFALNHGRDPMMLVGQGALGLALTALRLSSQSIWVPAGYHFAWNFMLMAVFAPPDALPALVPVVEAGPELWQGRAQRRPGLIAIAIHLSVALGAALVVWHRAQRQPSTL